MAIELASAYVSLLPSSRGFGKELDGQLQNEVGPVGDKHGQGLGGAVIGGITKVAALGGVGAALFGGVALKSGLERLTTIQDATASLTTIMGDAGKAGNLMNQIKETVNGTPFNLDQFATAGKNLVAMNVPAQKVPGYLRAIGEAAAASGKGAEGVSQITDTFGKMAAQGKVSLDQIWSISDAGVPALQILANGFGVTTDEMQKMISNGAVPSAKAMDILTKGIMDGSQGAAGATVAYAGTMEKLRGTFNGALGGMKASIARLGASVLEPLMPYLTAGMAKFTAWADTMGKKVGPEITKLIAGVKALVGSFQSGVVDQTGFIGKMERIGVVAGNVSYALLDVWNVLVKGKFTEPIFGQGQDSKFVGVLFKIREGLTGVGGLWKSLTTGASGEGGMPTWMYTVNEKVQDLHYVLLDLRNKDFTGVKEGLQSITDAGVPTGLSLAAIGDKAGGLGNSLAGAKDKSGGFMSTLKSLGGAFAATGSGGVTVLQNLLSGLAGTMAFLGHHTTLLTAIIVAIGVATAAQGPVNEAYKTAMIWRTALLPITTTATYVSASATRSLAAATREATAATTQGAAAQNTGILATIRGTATKVAHTIAESAKTVATGLGTAAMAAYTFATSGTVLATIRSTASTVAHGIATGAVRVATLAWTGVQWLLNAALSANPIGLVVIAITALVAGVILAYKNSETFRQIVQAAWQGIQAAASFAWNSIIKPALDGFMAGLRFVGDAATWLWHNAIEPGFAGIKFAIEVAWFAIRVIFDLWKAFIMDVLIPAVMTLWHNVIEPGFAAIGQIISGVWNNVIRPTFDFLKAALGAVGDFFRSIWESVIKPAWSALGDGIRFVYDSVLVPTWNGLKAALGAVGDFFNHIWHDVIQPAWAALGDGIRFVYERVILPNWEALKAALGLVGSFFEHIWNDIIKPAWNALGDGIRFVHDQVIQPTFDRMKSALDVVGRFFHDVVGGIKDKWDELRDAISKPITVVLKFLGDKLGGAWNAVRKVLPVLDEFPALPGLAKGGVTPGEGGRLRGPGTGTSDSILGMNYFTGLPTAHVSDGEFVVKKRAYDDNKPLVEGINAGLPRERLQYLAGGGTADSGLWRTMQEKASELFPQAAYGLAYRPGDAASLTPYHPTGRAIDIVPNDSYLTRGLLQGHSFEDEQGRAQDNPQLQAGLLDINRGLINKYGTGNIAEMISAVGTNINQGSPTNWNPDTLFGHWNHVHFAMEDAAAMGVRPPTAGGGGGATWPAMMGIIKGQFPWALDNSDVRPGDPGYHGKGQALDVGAPGNDAGQLAQAADWIGKNFTNSTELIHNPNGSIKFGKQVDPSFWGAETWAAHADHVHWANDRDPNLNKGSGPGFLGTVWNGVKGAASAVTHFLRDQAGHIFDAAMIVPNAAVDKLLPSPPPGFNAMPKGAWDSMRDAARGFIVGKADAADSASSSSGSTSMGPLGGNADAYAREIFRSAMEHGFGKPGGVIGIATGLVESNLREYANSNVPASLGLPHDAVGSDHDSVGIFQQRPSWGPLDQLMNPHASADLFFNRLGTFDWRSMAPGAAAQRVQVSAFPEAYNGRIGDAQAMVASYDLGGVASGVGLMPKKIIEPERVLAPRSTVAFEKMVQANFEPRSASSDQQARPELHGLHVEGDVFMVDPDEQDRRTKNGAARAMAMAGFR